MSEAAIFTMGVSFAVPSHDGQDDDLRDRLAYWLNAAYLGIGELSLTWPVAAFLRGL